MCGGSSNLLLALESAEAAGPLLNSTSCGSFRSRTHTKPSHPRCQVIADKYELLDKELLELVEDVLLNRCENATERLLDYAALLDPKSHPTAVKRKGQVGGAAAAEKKASGLVWGGALGLGWWRGAIGGLGGI